MATTKRERPVYVDIDGTLTVTPGRPWGEPIQSRVEAVHRLVRAGHAVVLWSGGGTQYARRFAAQHGIEAVACLGKPALVVDDNPNVSPSMDFVRPDWLDSC